MLQRSPRQIIDREVERHRSQEEARQASASWPARDRTDRGRSAAGRNRQARSQMHRWQRTRGKDVKGTTASNTAASEATAKPPAQKSAALLDRLFAAMTRNAAVNIWAITKFTASREIAPPIDEPELSVATAGPLCATSCGSTGRYSAAAGENLIKSVKGIAPGRTYRQPAVRDAYLPPVTGWRTPVVPG